MILTNPIDQNLVNVINKHKHGVVVMSELPSENYFGYIGACVKKLVEEGYGGVYVSFQRPFENIKRLFDQFKVRQDNLLFVDVASSFAQDAPSTHEKVIHIGEDLDINDLVRAIYLALPRINTKQKFIYIDSLSTISLHKPLSETLRFSEFLIRTTKDPERDDETVFLIFNISKDLSQKKFIQDIALRVDEVVR
jgi:KaiC/GvpD/RAD55 family RecA-like ATPase